MTLYVYPKIFRWDQIVPIEYPFIKVKGPNGAVGVLMVFDTLKEYTNFCEGDGLAPIKIEEGIENGKKQNESRSQQGKG